MTTEECYARMNADYADVLRRFGQEERVKRFLFRLPDDESYPTLCRMLDDGDGQEAFRAAHSLKGICMNLGLASLYESVNALTEELRSGQVTPAARPLAEQVKQDYLATVQCIRELMGS